MSANITSFRRNLRAKQPALHRKLFLETLDQRSLLAADLMLSANAIDENVPAETSVGTLSVANGQANENFTYQFVSGTGSDDNADFTIDGDNLQIKSSPNFEGQSSYHVLVEATGDQGTTTQETFTINVNDIAQESGRILTGFDPTTGQWFGSSLTNGNSQVLAQWSQGANWQEGVTGDFNGDGNLDIAARTQSGRIWVALSDQDGSGNLFSNVSIWGGSPASVDLVKVADVNNDGKDDLVMSFGQNGNHWLIYTSTGTSFDRQAVKFSGRLNWTDQVVGDFNGDGRTDIAARIDAGNDPSVWWVMTANANGEFNRGVRWGRWAGGDWQNVTAADMNGDGRTDLVGINPATGNFQLSQSSGTSFTMSNLGRGDFNSSATFQNVLAADLDGNGSDDLLGQNATTGDLFRLNMQGADAVFSDLGNATLDDQSFFAGNINDQAADVLFRRSAAGLWSVNQMNPAGTSLDPLAGANFQPTWDQSAAFPYTNIGSQNGALL